ncbi:MAG: helix-turn-helix domain-containing protein [Acidobacteriota bacterium]
MTVNMDSSKSHNNKLPIKDALEDAIDEMVAKGILWPEALEQFEKLFISRALRQSNGNLSRAAECMGIHRNSLSHKMRRYGIKKAGDRHAAQRAPGTREAGE